MSDADTEYQVRLMSFHFVSDDYVAGVRGARAAVALAWLAVLAMGAVCISGCSSLDKLPDGVQLQSSTFGVKVSPSAPDGTPFVIGSHTTIITTPQPADAGPNLNRFEGGAGVTGASVKSTVASGPVGDQLEKAGPAIQAVTGNTPFTDGDRFTGPDD